MDADEVLDGLSVRDRLVLYTLAQSERPVVPRKAAKATRAAVRAHKEWTFCRLLTTGSWQRALNRLQQRGLVVRIAEALPAAFGVTEEGRRTALVFAASLEVADFEPDMLADLRSWDRKAPFSRGPTDDFL